MTDCSSVRLEHKSDVLETFITEKKNIKENNCWKKKKLFEKAIHIMKRLLKCFKNSGCRIFCCCDNAPGQESQPGMFSECPFSFLKVFAASLVACVWKPVDPSQELRFVMSPSRGAEKKNSTLVCFFVLSWSSPDLQLHSRLPRTWNQNLSQVFTPKHCPPKNTNSGIIYSPHTDGKLG